eukprot:COSAG04_NODE_2147_length_4696_cov_27.649772_5_plen_276_part_00
MFQSFSPFDDVSIIFTQVSRRLCTPGATAVPSAPNCEKWWRRDSKIKEEKEPPRSPAARALPRRRARLTLRACRPAATLATYDGSGWVRYGNYNHSAVCGGGHEMTAGVHCAHFELRKLGWAQVGVAGPGFDPAAGGRPCDSAEGWLMYAYNCGNCGMLAHGGGASGWAGQPEDLKAGDVVVRRPPCAALRRGCAEGLACACRAWCSTSTPAGQTPAEDGFPCPFRLELVLVSIAWRRRGHSLGVGSGLLQPPRQNGENALKRGKNGRKNGRKMI